MKITIAFNDNDPVGIHKLDATTAHYLHAILDTITPMVDTSGSEAKRKAIDVLDDIKVACEIEKNNQE